jgi:hypothetical protein
MGTMSILERLKAEWNLYRSKSNLRFEAMQDQIAEFGRRLDKYDKPAHSHTKSDGKKGKRVNAKPVPILDRPEVMKASGVGQDPK